MEREILLFQGYQILMLFIKLLFQQDIQNISVLDP